MKWWGVGSALAILLSGFGIFLATPRPVQACECYVMTVPEKFNPAAIVFRGRVEARERVTVPENRWPMMAAHHFVVTRVWKGRVTEEIVVTTAIAGTSCDYVMETGQEYIVYAGEPPFYDTHWCDGTTKIEWAATDLARLGEGRAPLPGIDAQALDYDRDRIAAAAVAATGAAESEPLPVASQDAATPGWIGMVVGIAVGIGVATTVGVALAIAWARRRGTT